jgi:FAD-linked sulfhydryl oxidase
VNKRLKKPWFDCANLDGEYDCGCGDDPSKKKENQTPGNADGGSDPMDLEREQSVDRDTGVEMVKGG